MSLKSFQSNLALETLRVDFVGRIQIEPRHVRAQVPPELGRAVFFRQNIIKNNIKKNYFHDFYNRNSLKLILQFNYIPRPRYFKMWNIFYLINWCIINQKR